MELSENDGERRRRYREFINGMIKEKAAMKGEMNRRVAYGNEVFLKKLVREYKVDAVIRPKGRPRKEDNDGK